MKTIAFSIMVLLIASAISCENSDSGNKTPENIELKQVKEQLVSSANVFAFKFAKELFPNETAFDNVFISPLSIYFALAMTYNGANGTTEDAFKEVFGWEGLDDEQINLAAQSLINELLIESPDVLLEVANSIWTNEGFPILEEFSSNLETYYNATARELAFSEPASLDIINGWIEEKTHDKITDMLSALPAADKVLLINAVYFKANWQYQFSDTSNYTGNFFSDNDQIIEVTYMKQKEYFNYLSNNLINAIQLPYNDTNYYMQIMVPIGNNTTEDIFNSLDTATWNGWNSQFQKYELTVTIPKFKFEYGTKDISQELKNIGLEEAFEQDADFSSMSDEPLYIASVKHKAYIEVNEQGSEAAAATVVEMTWESISQDPTYFIANKSFVFAICEKVSNSVIFIGEVNDPVYSK